MQSLLPDPPILVISDRRLTGWSLEYVAEAVFAAGCRMFLLREKDLSPQKLKELARPIAELARRYGSALLVHGKTDVAIEVGAAGVHLPSHGVVAAARERLGPEALIGYSAHGSAELDRARDAGASYATLSPVFGSVSKPDHGPTLGLSELAVLSRQAHPLAVLALGGITADKLGRCRTAGASGIAVLGSVMAARDPGVAFEELLKAWNLGADEAFAQGAE